MSGRGDNVPETILILSMINDVKSGLLAIRVLSPSHSYLILETWKVWSPLKLLRHGTIAP
jgi:hypothetical protein